MTAWASPLPLERSPYQPAPDVVLKHLLGGSSTPHGPPSSPVCWLPLDRHVGFAYVDGTVMVITLSPSDPNADAQSYRLSEQPHLAVIPRGPLTHLEVGAVATTVRTKLARAAVQLLGLSRLARLGGENELVSSHWHAPATQWNRALLNAHVNAHDLVLAFVPLVLSLRTTSQWLGDVAVPAYLLVTPDRIALVGATLTGELYLPAFHWDVSSPSEASANAQARNGETIEPATFRCLDKGVFQLNEHRFKGTDSLSAIARCFEKQGDERVLNAAQVLCKTARSAADKRVAHDWLRGLASSSVSALSRVPEACLAHHLHLSAPTNPPWLDDTNVPNLVELWDTYGFDEELGAWLLGEVQDAGAGWRVTAVDLSEHLWRKRRERATDDFDKAQLDLIHARFAFGAGFPERARSALGTTPQLFPTPTLGDLNLPGFSEASPWRETRREVELLTRDVTAADPRQQDFARQRLAVLDPLNLDVLREATQSASLGQRARLALQLLSGPVTDEEPLTLPPRSQLRPLEDERIGSQLRHPLTRGRHGLTSKLADVIAVVRTPDESALRLYCERVTHADSPLLDALDRALTVLGLGHFDLYISRGKDDVGAQAFTAQGKLVLIGGQHTDPHSRHFLDPRELIFAFATELAHVRLGHSRVSGSDVMRGLLSKGKQGAELAFNLLPLVGGIHLGKRLGVVTAKLSLPQISKAFTAARTLESAVNTALPPEPQHADLSRPTEALLDTHRLEQLSADRAGLVCCGSLRAAFSAILKTRTDYVRVNSTLPTLGALAAIEQHAPANPIGYDDLALRLGSMIGFYLSDDYEELRRLTYR